MKIVKEITGPFNIDLGSISKQLVKDWFKYGTILYGIENKELSLEYIVKNQKYNYKLL